MLKRFFIICFFWALAPSYFAVADEIDACFAYDADHAEILEICQSALEQGGHSSTTESELNDYIGYALYQLDRCEEAFSNFDRAIELWPENLEAWEDRAWCHFELSNYAEAVHDFDQAFSLEASASRLAGKASALSLMDGDYLESLELIQAAQALDSEYAFAIREEGWIHIRADSPELALDPFQRALTLDPEDGYAHFGLGRAYANLDRLEQAKESVSNALIFYPDRPFYIAELANIERRLGELENALATTDRALEIYQESDDALVERFYVLDDMGRADEAFETAKTVLGLYPTSRFVLDNVLTLFDNQERHADALPVIESALVVYPNDPDFYLDLCHHLIRLERLEEGEAACRKVIAADPNTVFGYYNLAIVLLDQNEQDASLDAIQASIDNGLSKADYGDYVSYAFDSQGMVFGLRASRLAFQ